MANIIVRFSMYSENDQSDNIDILKNTILPEPNSFISKGEVRLLSTGKYSYPSKATTYNYKYSFEDILDVEIVNSFFLKEWSPFSDSLGQLKNSFMLSLNYEITIFNFEYPVLYFQPEYLSFLGKSGIVFSFYYYND